MPNITISGLPPATLPLDGATSFFEVQTIEAGVTVSRKVASDDINVASAIVIEDEGVPLAGGADTLNFVGANVVASGAGSTKTITIASGGQVNSVVGGVNINVNAGDPINPIVNLDAAITGVSIDGVTLNAVGAATNYLDESGAYSVPAGGGALTLNDLTDVDLTGQLQGDLLFNVDGVNWEPTVGELFWNGFDALTMNSTTVGSGGMQAVTTLANSHSFMASFNSESGQYVEIVALGTTSGDNTRLLFASGNSQLDVVGDNGVHVEFKDQALIPHIDVPAGAAFALGEKAAGAASVAGWGQLWAGTDQSLNFTDGLGVNTDLLAGGGGGLAPGTVTNATLRWSGAAWVEITQIQHVFAGATTLQIDGSGAFLQLNTTGASVDEKETRIKMDNFAGFAIQSVSDGGFNGPFLMGANRTGTAWQELQIQTDVQIFTGNFIMEGGTIYLEEISAALADTADYGQFWVLDDAPNVPMFTNDDGTDQLIDPSISEVELHNADYTLLLTDKGKTIYRTTTGFSETWTIPAESSVDYPIGTWIAFYNNIGADTSIAITDDLMRGTDGFTGTRTLGGRQRALVQKVESTVWVYQATDL